MMVKVNDPEIQSLIEKVYEHQQQHIFRFWEDLDESTRGILLSQLATLDFDLFESFVAKIRSGIAESLTYGNLEPPDCITLEDRKTLDAAAIETGAQHLAAGKVAAFLVAGGQGTRLGFDGPKGMFPVTPVKQKTLFQLHAEKIRAIAKKHGVIIPWYIMTSLTNHDQTVKYFEENNYFGFSPHDIVFFTQDMIPAVDRGGKLILDAPGHIFMNPNGHGGSIKALWDSDAINDMKKRGITTIFYFQVDNSLTRICDPAYIGYHLQQKSEMSCKVVHKSSPEEKMGILCKIDGHVGLIEYSDLDEENMYALDAKGSLKLWAGNIATHILEVDFVEKENRGGFQLPFHVAEKSIPYINNDGKKIRPKEKNGIKFESFVFDALPHAARTLALEVERKYEFGALKNREGENSPQTVKIALNNLYGQWLEECGQHVVCTANGDVSIDIEISPLFALGPQDLVDKKIEIDPEAKQIYLGE